MVVAPLLAAIGTATGASGGKQPPMPRQEPPAVGQLIVKLRAGKTQAATLPPQAVAALSQRGGVALAYGRQMSGGAHVVRLPARMPQAAAERIAERLKDDPDVEYAVADRVFRHMREPADELYAQQWHLHRVQRGREGSANLPAAWDVTIGNAQIVVAVLDTGLLPHADIDRNILDDIGRVAPGFDFITDAVNAGDGSGRDRDPTDPGDFLFSGACGELEPLTDLDSSWHGTHVAGTIGALTDNGSGVAGVNWRARIQPVRVLGKCGGQLSDIADALRWAAGLRVIGVPDNRTPARVLNLSLGGSGPCSPAEQAAIDDVVAAGAAVVVAAGNSNADAADFSPASCRGVITVAATDIRGQRSVYSNVGRTIEISAPGGDFQVDPGVLSTSDSGRQDPLHDDNYAAYQGTSMAAPQVAGVLSLLLAKNASLGPDALLGIIRSSARPFPRYGDQYDCSTSICGSGLLDAAAAMAAVPDMTPDTFAFGPVTEVEPGAIVVSGSITVSGIDQPAPISVTGGQYSIDGGPFTAETGTVRSGQMVRLQLTAPAELQQTAFATLNVGDTPATFVVATRGPVRVTEALAPSGGGGGLVSPMTLLALLALCFRRRAGSPCAGRPPVGRYRRGRYAAPVRRVRWR